MAERLTKRLAEAGGNRHSYWAGQPPYFDKEWSFALSLGYNTAPPILTRYSKGVAGKGSPTAIRLPWSHIWWDIFCLSVLECCSDSTWHSCTTFFNKPVFGAREHGVHSGRCCSCFLPAVQNNKTLWYPILNWAVHQLGETNCNKGLSRSTFTKDLFASQMEGKRQYSFTRLALPLTCDCIGLLHVCSWTESSLK